MNSFENTTETTSVLSTASQQNPWVGAGILPNSLLILAFLGAGPKLLQAKQSNTAESQPMQLYWPAAKDEALQHSQNLQADALGPMAATFQEFKEESLTVLTSVIIHILLRWAEAEDLTLQLATGLQHVNP